MTAEPIVSPPLPLSPDPGLVDDDEEDSQGAESPTSPVIDFDLGQLTASAHARESSGPQLPLELKGPVLAFVEHHVQRTLPDFCRPGAGPADEDLLNVLIFVCEKARKRRWVPAAEAASKGRMLVMRELESKGWPHRCWREAHGFLSLIEAAKDAAAKQWVEALRNVDLGLIFGLALDDLIAVPKLLAYVEPRARPRQAFSVMPILAPTQSEVRESGDICALRLLSLTTRMKVLPTQGLISLRGWNCPVLLMGLSDAWPAMQTWCDLGFWDSKYGHRTVPIQVEQSDTAGGCAVESKITIHEFVGDYLLKSTLHGLWPRHGRPSCSESAGEKPPVAYLANYDLFRQLPHLQMDFETDPLPRNGSDSLAPQPSQVTMWFSTGGAVTPLHLKKEDTLVVQVAGAKLVRVYDAKESKHLLEVVDGLLDVEDPDLDKYPGIAEASFAEHILRPGESLYIPRGTWHYDRSLATSMSVNFSYS